MLNINSALHKPVVLNGTPCYLPYPRIGIYYGRGASHSWLWLVETLDALGFWNIEFIDETLFNSSDLAHFDVLFVSGGDTFAIAEGLGKEGAIHLAHFLKCGGLYIGSCAGAYLPLNSSIFPLNLFNFVSAKISNLTSDLPSPRELPEKFCTPYAGCRYVFHPVREEVIIRLNNFTHSFRHQDEFYAPLYGGPIFHPSDTFTTIASYTGFTPRTRFLTDYTIAYDTLVGKPAVILSRVGEGLMYLLGPHLEHPNYPAANILLAEMIYHGISIVSPTSPSPSPSPLLPRAKIPPNILRDLKSELSNARIVALALERDALRWQIGHKIYEPEKIRVFFEAMWRRWDIFAAQKSGNPEEVYAMFTMARSITRLLRTIKQRSISGSDSTSTAQELFVLLKNFTASFLTCYFRERMVLITQEGAPNVHVF